MIGSREGFNNNHHQHQKQRQQQACSITMNFGIIFREGKKSLKFKTKEYTNLNTSCAFGRICSSLLIFFTLKHSTAGDGLLVKTLIIPLGNDIVMSPVIFTIHLKLGILNSSH